MSAIKYILTAIATTFLLSGPLHGAIFQQFPSRRVQQTTRMKGGKQQNLGRHHYPRHIKEADEGTDVGPIVRSGSCSQVPYGSLDIERRENLADLPLNDLLVALQKPPFVTAPNPDGPTIVDIGLYVYEIAQIDPGENTYLMEGFLDLVWCDPRLRFGDDDNKTSVSEPHIFLESDAAKELEYIWWPTIFFVNEVMPRRIENEEIIISPDGTVEYREKFGVQLSSNFDMISFPFDSQVLVAEIESFAWPSHILQFHIEEDLVGFSDEFDIPEYQITGIKEHLEERQEPRDRHPFSELVAEVFVARDPVYYVTKVIVPLGLIVCISWAVFWMDGENLADRMAISFTGVLTSVAYQFIVAESLPRHIYNTFLDNFVLFSFVMMALTIIENIAVSMLLKRGKADTREIIGRMESRINLMESSSRNVVQFEDEEPARTMAMMDKQKSSSGDQVVSVESTHSSNDDETKDRPNLSNFTTSNGERNSESGSSSNDGTTWYQTLWNKICSCVNPPGTGPEKAAHLDKVCRYAFPSMYVVGVSILAGVQVV